MHFVGLYFMIKMYLFLSLRIPAKHLRFFYKYFPFPLSALFQQILDSYLPTTDAIHIRSK